MPERSDSMARPRSVWPHRLALLTAGATFPLLFIGGLVTSKGAGLAVPDWPTTFGYNMFLYPWSEMVGNIFYEHSHRLVASTVGLLTIFLCVALWMRESRSWVRWLGAGALALVIVQGVIGGLRVVLLEQQLAIVHACLAQAFFALTVALALFTSRDWSERTETVACPDAARLRFLCVFTTALIYLQAVAGAVLRHTGAALEIHLLLAFLIAVHVALLARRAWQVGRTGRSAPTRGFTSRSEPGAMNCAPTASRQKLARPATLLVALLVLQLALGLASYLGKFSALGAVWSRGIVVAVTTTHVVVGALLLAVCVLLTLRAFRFLAPADSAQAQFASQRAPA